jgi:energy-coupling factor transporter ATP-binding protein EcfA2
MAVRHDPEGSKWHRWDPHIHAPGTILNDQFGGDWEGWLTRIETSDPPIRALGITDYYSTAGYEAVMEKKNSGRLSNVDLIFPNVELRLDVGTRTGSGINVHLLARPDASDHVDELKRFLRTLSIRLDGKLYCCEHDDLVRLGLEHEPNLAGNPQAALRSGVNQFKVGWGTLRDQWEQNTWAKENILIAVDSGKAGTSGVQDQQFAALRKEIERYSHIIFSASESDRLYWLGQGADSIDQIRKYKGPKPCIHGSDAHRLAQVGKPDDDRNCWIKGDLTFDTVEQVVFEPEFRVRIGPDAPDAILDSLAIAEAGVEGAPWFASGGVRLNRGMVAVIGARGSGKTALADVIAAAGQALGVSEADRSFVARAQEHLGGAKARLIWGDGDDSICALKPLPTESPYPRVQYLSQQFVDTLCSPEGPTDELLREMKRVVFDAHDAEQRMGAANFDQLLESATANAQSSRSSAETTLSTTISQLYTEWQRHGSLKGLQRRREQLTKTLESDKAHRSKLIGAVSDELAKRMNEVSTAVEEARLRVEASRREIQAVERLRAEAASVRGERATGQLQQIRQQYAAANLSEQEWSNFRLDFVGPVDAILADKLTKARGALAILVGTSPASAGAPDQSKPLIDPGTPLGGVSLSLLEREMERLRQVVGIVRKNAATLQQLSKNIDAQETALAQVLVEIEAAQNAQNRMAELNAGRLTTYKAIFDSIEAEETALLSLYEPLRVRLSQEGGSLTKLSFSVRRKVNVKAWALEGEDLMDLRRQGDFQGTGRLLKAAMSELLDAWQNGSSAEVAQVFNAFTDQHLMHIVNQSKVDRNDAAAFGRWWRDVLNWLYGTEHITVDYSIRYDSIEIDRLSPGTRGIVLLLLYLAIDQNDDRPLVIDQPEENLDPRSIYDDVVQHFRTAKLRRQIIIITHNANLVVNADADQVVVAQATPHDRGKLPQISYESGALENPSIREKVCDILEGGKLAFRERARRLRVRIGP